MPITYSYNSRGYLDVKMTGSITDSEILESRVNYFSETEWIPGLPELIDLSQADFEKVTPNGLKKIAAFSDQLLQANKVKMLKLAVYAPDMLPAVLISLFADEQSVEKLRVFNDKEEALSWLIEDLIHQEYSIDLDKGIVYIKYSGVIIAELLIEQILRIRRDPNFHNGLNSIADLRKTTYPDATRNMIKMADFTHASAAQRGDFKLAQIINPGDSEYVELYKELTMKGHVKLCYSMSEAEEWLCKE